MKRAKMKATKQSKKEDKKALERLKALADIVKDASKYEDASILLNDFLERREEEIETLKKEVTLIKNMTEYTPLLLEAAERASVLMCAKCGSKNCDIDLCYKCGRGDEWIQLFVPGTGDIELNCEDVVKKFAKACSEVSPKSSDAIEIEDRFVDHDELLIKLMLNDVDVLKKQKQKKKTKKKRAKK